MYHLPGVFADAGGRWKLVQGRLTKGPRPWLVQIQLIYDFVEATRKAATFKDVL